MAVAGPLNNSTMMHGDGWVDQVTAKGPKARKDSILIQASQPRITESDTRIAASFRVSLMRALAYPPGIPTFRMIS